MAMKKPRRWRMWACFQGDDRFDEADECLKELKLYGYQAKVWAPLPHHKTSGHIHIVVLCTLDELLKLAGVETKHG